MLHCPELPLNLGGGGILAYSLHAHNDATGATVAVANARCPIGRYFTPLGPPNSTKVNLNDLKSNLELTCNHHTRQWTPELPQGGCMTRE